MPPALHTVERRLVPGEIVDQVLEGVISGDLLDGEALPSERELARVLGVSRPTVREALQRMEATRMVVVRQGGRTTVRDFRRTGGLDLLPRVLVRRGVLDLEVARSVVEARLDLGPIVAALAAEQGHDTLSETLNEVLDDLVAAEDTVERQVQALQFWDEVVAGSGSMVYQLMFNNLRAAYEPALEALVGVLHKEVTQVGAYRLLVAAIGMGDAGAARDAADQVLRPTTERLLAALDRMEKGEEATS